MKNKEEKWDRDLHQGKSREQVEYTEKTTFYVMVIGIIALCAYYIYEFFVALV